jgi:membrane protein implicated in regulation of membrane protease activity
MQRNKYIAIAVAATAAVGLGVSGIADAASGHRHAKRHSAKQHSTASRGAETELTGATAQSAKDAALAAVPGGTVWRASKEDPNDPSGAAYEVHVTKSDGSEVEVLEDSSFNVIATNASQQHARHG